MILPKIVVSFGFSQILCSSITWNKHKESLFVNSEEMICTENINLSKKGLIWQIIISHAHEFFDYSGK